MPFWRYFEYLSPQYDEPAADSMGRVAVLPNVEEYYCYSRFQYKTSGDSATVLGAAVNQSYLCIPDTYRGKPVRTIGNGFGGTATLLRDLLLPASVQKIEVGAFSRYAPEIIFYEGTAEEFAAISIGVLNDALRNTRIYYYSEYPPTDSEGNYWYYSDEGRPGSW